MQKILRAGDLLIQACAYDWHFGWSTPPPPQSTSNAPIYNQLPPNWDEKPVRIPQGAVAVAVVCYPDGKTASPQLDAHDNYDDGSFDVLYNGKILRSPSWPWRSAADIGCECDWCGWQKSTQFE